MAGVSTATVSRVINQTAWVEPVTRERVEKAMRDLNYRRNAAAIALAKRSGDMLGLLTGNLADPFFARLARGVEDVSRKQQYRLMVCSGGHDEEMEKAGLDFLVNQGCEAIVVHASRLPDKELLRREEKRNPRQRYQEEADHHRPVTGAVDKFRAHNHFRLTHDDPPHRRPFLYSGQYRCSGKSDRRKWR